MRGEGRQSELKEVAMSEQVAKNDSSKYQVRILKQVPIGTPKEKTAGIDV